MTGTLDGLDDAALYLGAHACLAAGKNATAAIQEAGEQGDVLVVNILGADITANTATATTLFALYIFGRAFGNSFLIALVTLFITVFFVVVEVVIFPIIPVIRGAGGRRRKARCPR